MQLNREEDNRVQAAVVVPNLTVVAVLKPLPMTWTTVPPLVKPVLGETLTRVGGELAGGATTVPAMATEPSTVRALVELIVKGVIGTRGKINEYRLLMVTTILLPEPRTAVAEHGVGVLPGPLS